MRDDENREPIDEKLPRFHTGGEVSADDVTLYDAIRTAREVRVQVSEDVNGKRVDHAVPVEQLGDVGWTAQLLPADFESSSSATLVDTLYRVSEPQAYDVEHRPGAHSWRDWFGRGWELRPHPSAACGSWWHRRWAWGSLTLFHDCKWVTSGPVFFADGDGGFERTDQFAISGVAQAFQPGRSFGWFTVLGPEWPGSKIEGIDDGT